MSKGVIKSLIVAVALTIGGCLIFMMAIGLGGAGFGILSSSDYETVTHKAENDFDSIVIDEAASTVWIRDPETSVDVGAIAKGYATEQVAKWLEKQDIYCALLNVGGNVRAAGKKPDGTPWTVGLENPQDVETDYLAYLSLANEALVTSGSYQRYYIVDGKSYHHIIHPDTLMPAEGYLAVSVVCHDSGLGDALSTALFCMSIEEGKALVATLDGVAVSWVTSDGKQTVSDGWNNYVKD